MKKLVLVSVLLIQFYTTSNIIAQTNALYDIFPLAKWNKYTYNYLFTDSTYYVGSFESFQQDSGRINYTIIDSVNFVSRIEWTVEQEIDLTERIITPLIDSTFKINKKFYFVLTELLENDHPLSASPQSGDSVDTWGRIGIWDFPVYAPNNTTIIINRFNSNIQFEICNNFSDFLDSLWFDSERGLYKRIFKTTYLGNHQIYTQTKINFEGAIVSNDDRTFIYPNKYLLNQNYPNPFNPSTNISWQTPVSCWQTLKVYDVLGNEVATLVNEYRPAGSYEIEFNPASSIKNPASGIYFYRLQAGEYFETKKMILLK
ncbi:MAG: T9SS type A sorting domain-containing protein [Ignavibacteriales bacterium]|nr:T9SS type A sorting domain-containing protein [Ignavibacteriales bacterium]